MQKSISVFPVFFISAQLYALLWEIIFWKKFSFFIHFVALSKKLAKLIFLCPFVKQNDQKFFLETWFKHLKFRWRSEFPLTSAVYSPNFLHSNFVCRVTPVSTATQSVSRLQALLSGSKAGPSDRLLQIFQ